MPTRIANTTRSVGASSFSRFEFWTSRARQAAATTITSARGREREEKGQFTCQPIRRTRSEEMKTSPPLTNNKRGGQLDALMCAALAVISLSRLEVVHVHVDQYRSKLTFSQSIFRFPFLSLALVIVDSQHEFLRRNSSCSHLVIDHPYCRMRHKNNNNDDEDC